MPKVPVSSRCDAGAVQGPTNRTTSDQTPSLLLDLPGELRNRIYQFAIGGHVIVVKSVWKSGTSCHLNSRLYTCTTRQNSSGTHDSPITIEDNYEDEGGQCCGKASDILALSQVCRQLHAETAILPYATNTFYFKERWDLRFFADKISAAQAESISSIALDPEGTFLLIPGYKIRHWPGMLPICLPRLRNIYVAPSYSRMFHWNLGSSDAQRLAALEKMLVVDTAHEKGLRISCFNVFDELANPGEAEGMEMRCMREKKRSAEVSKMARDMIEWDPLRRCCG